MKRILSLVFVSSLLMSATSFAQDKIVDPNAKGETGQNECKECQKAADAQGKDLPGASNSKDKKAESSATGAGGSGIHPTE